MARLKDSGCLFLLQHPIHSGYVQTLVKTAKPIKTLPGNRFKMDLGKHLRDFLEPLTKIKGYPEIKLNACKTSGFHYIYPFAGSRQINPCFQQGFPAEETQWKPNWRH